MKYCSECGNELLDKAEICPRCGCRVSPPRTAGKSSSSNEDLDLITKIFLILGTIALGVFLIPLAWCIPMTVHAFECINENKPLSTGFKVCTLLFVSMIAGILMLCRKD